MQPIISLQSVHKSYGTKQVLNGINLTIQAGQVIGYIGPNGAGKSTMLKLLAGHQSPTKGEVTIPKDCKIGYLPQDMTHQHGRTVFEETESAFAEIKAMQARLDDINHQLETQVIMKNLVF